MKTISLFGPFPTPVGGVSTHLERLAIRLKYAGYAVVKYNTSCSVSDDFDGVNINKITPKVFRRYMTISSLFWLFKYGLKDRSNILHFHSPVVYNIITLFLLFIFTKKQLVVTIHDEYQYKNIKNYPRILAWLFEYYIHLNTNVKWIVVNKNIFDQLISLGLSSNNIRVIPAFIPSNKIVDISVYEDLHSFMKTGTDLRILYYAHAVSLFGKDIYSIDQTIMYGRELKSKHIDFKLLMIISIDDPRLQYYYDKINLFGLQKEILLTVGHYDLWSIFHHFDLYIRPTLTDGDSLAVRESLFKNVNVLASDCVERPNSCILFKTSDLKDMIDKTLLFYSNRNQYQKFQKEDYFSEICDFYNSTISF